MKISIFFSRKQSEPYEKAMIIIQDKSIQFLLVKWMDLEN